MKQLTPELYQRLLSLSLSQRAAIVQQLKNVDKETSPLPEMPQQLVAYVVPAGNTEASGLDIAALTQTVKAKLPSYMVPNVVVPLAQLPLNANGKIDVKALPAPPRVRVNCDSIAAPTTATESNLADIWCAVLRLDSVGIHDNFFELGGDSILTIQIVSRAREAGLRLAPNQLFEQPTIAELAAVVNVVPEVVATQTVVTGNVPLTPIQHWFVSQKMAAPYHWHQARVFALPIGVDRAQVERAIAALWQHHDALRMHFSQTDDGWKQVNSSVEHPPRVDWVDVAGLSDEEQRHAIAQHGSRLHANLNNESHVLMAVACFTRGEGQSVWMMMSLHHWLVDGVSLQILQEDLERLLLGVIEGAAELPAKTTSYKEWAETLLNVVSERLPEADFWCAQVESSAISLFNREVYTGPLEENRMTELVTYDVEKCLSAVDTQSLLKSVPAVYNTQINDVLLTALTQALLQWKKLDSGSVLVEVEGHGREFISEEVDLSRTVGWLTTTYPIRLSLETVSDCGSAIKSIKEQLRQVPDGGIGYGMLRYLATEKASGIIQDIPGDPLPLRLVNGKQPEVLFNYLGNVSDVAQHQADNQLSVVSDLDVGVLRSPQNVRSQGIELNAAIVSGQLRCSWRSDDCFVPISAMEELAERYIQQLKVIIEHCVGSQTGGFTPSDFPDADLDQGELDSFISQLTGG
ncbi:MAG: condensation domain-containing protein [Cyanobacteria bacterium J06573_11]